MAVRPEDAVMTSPPLNSFLFNPVLCPCCGSGSLSFMFPDSYSKAGEVSNSGFFFSCSTCYYRTFYKDNAYEATTYLKKDIAIRTNEKKTPHRVYLDNSLFDMAVKGKSKSSLCLPNRIPVGSILLVGNESKTSYIVCKILGHSENIGNNPGWFLTNVEMISYQSNNRRSPSVRRGTW